MTPRLRLPLRPTRLLPVVAVLLLPYGTATAHGHPGPSGPPTASSSASPSASASASAPASASASRTPAASKPASPSGSRSSSPSATASAAVSASAVIDPSRAGSLAGEGRLRPGRHDEDDSAEDQGDRGDQQEREHTHRHDRDESPTASATTSESPQQAGLLPSAAPPAPAGRDVAQSGEDTTEPVLRILPLGSGLVLIGVGLGLAFVGLRLRRS